VIDLSDLNLPAPVAVPKANPAPAAAKRTRPAAAQAVKLAARGEEQPRTDSEAKSRSNDTNKKEAAKADDKRKSDEKGRERDKDDRSAGKGKSIERYWVQVAGGANKADLPKAYARLKDKSPKLLSGRSAWTTPLRATNRLLVGPFKTLAEAQEFVNLAGKAMPSFTYTSPAGQEIEKLPPQ
jgi:hypothetical protein